MAQVGRRPGFALEALDGRGAGRTERQYLQRNAAV
jgi:hypothetical protein